MSPRPGCRPLPGARPRTVSTGFHHRMQNSKVQREWVICVLGCIRFHSRRRFGHHQKPQAQAGVRPPIQRTLGVQRSCLRIGSLHALTGSAARTFNTACPSFWPNWILKKSSQAPMGHISIAPAPPPPPPRAPEAGERNSTRSAKSRQRGNTLRSAPTRSFFGRFRPILQFFADICFGGR